MWTCPHLKGRFGHVHISFGFTMWIVKDYIHQKVSSVLKNLFTSLKGSKRVLMHQMCAPLLVQRLNKWYLINHINNKKTMNFSYKNGEKLNHSSLRA